MFDNFMMNHTIKSRTRHLNVSFIGMFFSQHPNISAKPMLIFSGNRRTVKVNCRRILNVLRQLFFYLLKYFYGELICFR